MADQRLIAKEAPTLDEPLTLAYQSFRSNSGSLLGRVRSESFKRDIDQNDEQDQIEIQRPPTPGSPLSSSRLAAGDTLVNTKLTTHGRGFSGELTHGILEEQTKLNYFLDNIDSKYKIPACLTYSYFFMQGILALGCFSAIIDIIDFVNDKYPGYMFDFWADMPGNIALPFSFPLVKLCSTSDPNKRMVICMVMNVVLTNIMLVNLFLWPDNMPSY
jgi:hypothetical protein